MGRELFDHAFRTYAQRWKFKHPTPEDFFRTMEDASAVDLDWFWRGWFYSTDYVDIGIKEVKQYFVSENPTKQVTEQFNRRGRKISDAQPMVYMVAETSEDFKPEMKKALEIKDVKLLSEYVAKLSADEKKELKTPKYFYEVEFDKPGGMMMPIIVELQFEDGTKENHHFPVQNLEKRQRYGKTRFRNG